MERVKYDLGNGIVLFEDAEQKVEPTPTVPSADAATPVMQQMVRMIVGRQDVSPVNYSFHSKNAWENTRAMRRDPVVASAIDFKWNAIFKDGWEIEPASDDPKHIEQAEFIEYALKKGRIEKICNDLKDGMFIGYCVLEKVWGNLPTGEKIITGAIPHDPQGIAFEVDKNWDVQKIAVHHPGGGRTTYPANRFIYWAYNPVYGHPYGQGDWTKVFRAWYIKYQALVLWTRFVERNASGTRVYKYASGTTEEQQTAIYEQLHQDGSLKDILMPIEDELEIVIGSASDGGGSFHSLIAMCDTQIVRGIVGASLQAEEGARTGSMAQSKVHDQTAKVGSKALGRTVECLINEQWIAPVMRVNYPGETEYPSIKIHQVDQEELKAKFDMVSRAMDSGWVYTDEPWLRSEFGIPADHKTPEERQKEQEEVEAQELENALMLGKEANRGFGFAKKPCGDKGKGECDYDTATGRYGSGSDGDDSRPKVTDADWRRQSRTVDEYEQKQADKSGWKDYEQVNVGIEGLGIIKGERYVLDGVPVFHSRWVEVTKPNSGQGTQLFKEFVKRELGAGGIYRANAPSAGMKALLSKLVREGVFEHITPYSEVNSGYIHNYDYRVR